MKISQISLITRGYSISTYEVKGEEINLAELPTKMREYAPWGLGMVWIAPDKSRAKVECYTD